MKTIRLLIAAVTLAIASACADNTAPSHGTTPPDSPLQSGDLVGVG
jgi:hypothetical protein